MKSRALTISLIVVMLLSTVLLSSISAARLKRKVGKTLTVLIDEAGAKGGIGRSSADAPEIDGVVRVKAHASLKRNSGFGRGVFGREPRTRTA